ncbi:MAG: AbgT family transporter [Suipraeoptans sp.]
MKVTNNNKQNKIGIIEKVGSALPESNLLFLILIAVIIVVSFLAKGEYQGVQEGVTYEVRNLLSLDGARWILYHIIPNFIAYPPLGIIVVGVIGFGFSEKIGLLGTIIKKVGTSTPEKFILPIIIFVGINSSVASDAGYIVLIPLAAAMYAGLGKNPLIGVAAAFAAVSSGFGAAMIPTPTDGMLGEITKSVVVDTMGLEFTLNTVTMNYIFMIVSTIFLTVLITFITKKFVEKRVNHYEYVLPTEGAVHMGELTKEEKKGLRAAGIALIIVVVALVVLYFTGMLQSYDGIVEATGVEKTFNPILDNIIVIMICLFLFPAIAYGRATGVLKSGKDYVSITTKAMGDVSYILVFAIFAGNFLAIFSRSGIDRFVANHGAELLINLNIKNDFLLIIMFMVIAAFINLFLGSASAKWMLLAPIFIVMLDAVSGGSLTPDIIQAAYRVADSSTNIVTPLMTFMGVVLLAAKKYAPKFEIGNLISVMMPYSIAIFLGWGGFFLIYMLTGLPFGI